ncbi:MAG: hypothetical protein ACRC2T_18180, partial [Thermoguttaceae bacterium]
LPEGDLGITMPLSGSLPAPVAQIDQKEPIRIKLFSDENGKLTDIQLGDKRLGPNPHQLREQIKQIVGDAVAKSNTSDLEAILDFDNLKYEFLIQIMDAVNGYVQDGKIIPLIEKVNFTE